MSKSRSIIHLAAITLLLILTVQSPLPDKPCTPSVSSFPQYDTFGLFATTIRTKMTINTTYCYDLYVGQRDDDRDRQHFVLEITLQDAWQESTVLQKYNFAMPLIGVHCDCINKSAYQTGPDNCSDHFKNPNTTFCGRKYLNCSSCCESKFDLPACSIGVYTHPTYFYRALYLDTPKIYHQLNFVIKKNNTVITDAIFVFTEIDLSIVYLDDFRLNSGSRVSKLSRGFRTNTLRSYSGDHSEFFSNFDENPDVVRNDTKWWLEKGRVLVNTHTHEVMQATIPFNEAMEDNLDKLGWLKCDGDNQLTDFNMSLLVDAFHFEGSVKPNEIRWNLNAQGFLKVETKDLNSSKIPGPDEYSQSLRVLNHCSEKENEKKYEIYCSHNSVYIDILNVPFSWLVVEEPPSPKPCSRNSLYDSNYTEAGSQAGSIWCD